MLGAAATTPKVIDILGHSLRFLRALQRGDLPEALAEARRYESGERERAILIGEPARPLDLRSPSPNFVLWWWSRASDRCLSDEVVRSLFSIIRDGGGATLGDASVPSQGTGRTVYHLGAVTPRVSPWLEALLSAPDLRAGWSILSTLGESPLHIVLKNGPWWEGATPEHDALAGRVVDSTNDQTLDLSDNSGNTTLQLALHGRFYGTVGALLRRGVGDARYSRRYRTADLATVEQVFAENLHYRARLLVILAELDLAHNVMPCVLRAIVAQFACGPFV